MLDSVVKIDEKAASSKLSVLRHYFLEILLIVFSIAIVFLFNQQRKDREISENRANENAVKIEKYLDEDRKLLIEKLSENTQVIKEFLQFAKEQKNGK